MRRYILHKTANYTWNLNWSLCLFDTQLTPPRNLHKSKGDKIKTAKRLRKFGADKRAKTKWPIRMQMFWRWANNNNGNRRQKKCCETSTKMGNCHMGNTFCGEGEDVTSNKKTIPKYLFVVCVLQKRKKTMGNTFLWALFSIIFDSIFYVSCGIRSLGNFRLKIRLRNSIIQISAFFLKDFC